MLSPEAKQMIIDNYRGRFHKYGAGPKVAEWNSVESQEMRFEQLCKLGDMQGASVHDIGCGIADIVSAFSRDTNRFHNRYSREQTREIAFD